jgi:cytochrome oxidase Cu insertion factor (SCO1/SenC/PrrC family)
MPLPDPSLEPAIRDPKKLRNTALILVAIMLLGGVLILLRYKHLAAEAERKAYENFAQEQKSSLNDASRENRPAYIYRITPERDLRVLRQDGQIANLVDLRGKLIAVNVMSLRDPQAAQRSLEVMKRLAAARAETADLALVTLIVDPIPSEKLRSVLEETAAANGMRLPQWWLGSNEPKTLHKFIKNELKATTYPNELSGKWDYDASIVLIDKNGHIRRAVVPQKQGGDPFVATFDFDQAAAWDAKGAKTGTEHSNVEQLEILLNRTIDKLLAEPFKN